MTCNSPCETFEEVVEALPTSVEIRMLLGTDATFEAEILDAAGTPIDISADEVSFTVRAEKQGSIVVQKTNGVGEHSNPTAGRTVFKLERGDFPDQDDDERVLVFEVRRIRPAGAGETVHIQGPFILELAVGG